MSDKELLELAAKAAGLDVWTDIDGNRYTGEPERPWIPLTDDGDALRLAVKLRIEVERSQYSEHSVYAGPPMTAKWKEESCGEQDIYAATRKAIVMAAAEIGRAMP